MGKIFVDKDEKKKVLEIIDVIKEVGPDTILLIKHDQLLRVLINTLLKKRVISGKDLDKEFKKFSKLHEKGIKKFSKKYGKVIEEKVLKGPKAQDYIG